MILNACVWLVYALAPPAVNGGGKLKSMTHLLTLMLASCLGIVSIESCSSGVMFCLCWIVWRSVLCSPVATVVDSTTATALALRGAAIRGGRVRGVYPICPTGTTLFRHPTGLSPATAAGTGALAYMGWVAKCNKLIQFYIYISQHNEYCIYSLTVIVQIQSKINFESCFKDNCSVQIY